MKKKIYFIISSVIQIVFSIYTAFNSSQIVKETVDVINASYPENMRDRTLTALQNNGETFIIILSLIVVLLNIWIIYNAIKGNVLKKKGKFVACSLISLFVAENTIVQLLSFINLVVLVFCKRKNPEDFPEKKKEIPKAEYIKSTKKEKLFALCLVLAYALQDIIGIFMPEDLSFSATITIAIMIYVVLFILAILIFKDRLKKDIKIFKDNFKAYIQFIFPKLGLMYIIYIISSLICSAITGNAVSENQATIEALPQWFIIPAAIIWAPVVEELLFRGVIRRFIKNDKLFIIISGVAFGLIHTIAEATLMSVIVMAIPYAILGGFFAYLYAKTDNICSNMLSHAFHNTIMVILLNLLFI